ELFHLTLAKMPPEVRRHPSLYQHSPPEWSTLISLNYLITKLNIDYTNGQCDANMGETKVDQPIQCYKCFQIGHRPSTCVPSVCLDCAMFGHKVGNCSTESKQCL